MTASNTAAIVGNTPGTSGGWKCSSVSDGSSYECSQETGPPMSSGVFVRHWPGETAAGRSLEAESAARRRLGAKGAKPLCRDQLYPGEHHGVVAGRRCHAGQQPAVFLPDRDFQHLARIRHAGETCAVRPDGGDIGVE